ncbi:MAG: UDP-N-acetylglucosamine--N-acetylmuramyl-(pentapeptide) pyrophosphoryl-undecaprenol N-acetylglucosamine transferase [Patescibacteria group bacterium]
MKIFFSGGGTLGPVTPLLTIYDTLKRQYPDIEAVWFGTKNGPERELVQKKGIEFAVLPSGKLRRYFSFWNITDAPKIIYAFFASARRIRKLRPVICISAGGFVSVPLHWAARFLGVPTWIHQQDIEVGLANRLMSWPAKIITVSLRRHLNNFSAKKTVWLGNPVRNDLIITTRDEGLDFFQLDRELPVIFATGGGTGSLRLNQLIMESVAGLEGVAQIIHLSGKDRPRELIASLQTAFPNHYRAYQFFTDEMKYAYAAADIIISRGGFGTLTEIAALGKPAIIVPKPGHQEQNVAYLSAQGAVIQVNERTTDGNYLAKIIAELLADKNKMRELGGRLRELLPRARTEDIVAAFDRAIRAGSIGRK